MNYYDILINGISDELYVSRIINGKSWVAAELSDGRFGIAMHYTLESRERKFDTLEGLDARTAASAVLSWNFQEATEGMAVINAYYNTPEHMDELGAHCSYNKSCTQGMVTEGKKIALIGHLSLQPDALKGASEVYIIEREPKPGDYPDSACEYILPQCDIVVMTASAAVNKTMPRLIELSKCAKTVIIGPTAPLCPELKALGIDRISGLIIRDKEAFERWAVENHGSPYPYGDVFMI